MMNFRSKPLTTSPDGTCQWCSAPLATCQATPCPGRTFADRQPLPEHFMPKTADNVAKDEVSRETKRITVYIPEGLWMYLREQSLERSVATGTSVSISQIITELVENDRKRREERRTRTTEEFGETPSSARNGSAENPETAAGGDRVAVTAFDADGKITDVLSPPIPMAAYLADHRITPDPMAPAAAAVGSGPQIVAAPRHTHVELANQGGAVRMRLLVLAYRLTGDRIELLVDNDVKLQWIDVAEWERVRVVT